MLNATLLSQCIAFMLFVALMTRFVWPKMVNVLEAREQKIRAGVENFARAEAQLHLAQASAKEYLRKAKHNANELEENAQHTAEKIKSSAQLEGNQQRLKLVEQGKAELALQVRQAEDQLQGQAAQTALEIAQKILELQVTDVTSDLLSQPAVKNLLQMLPSK